MINERGNLIKMRLNLVSPAILTDQHLIAEKRELRMIPPLLHKKFIKRGFSFKNDIPPFFVLGTGHMNFWLDKFSFLESRYRSLEQEMINRGFFVGEGLIIDTFLSKEIGCYHDWQPREQDIQLSRERIKEKLLLKPRWYRFHSNPINLNWIVENYF